MELVAHQPTLCCPCTYSPPQFGLPLPPAHAPPDGVSRGPGSSRHRWHDRRSSNNLKHSTTPALSDPHRPSVSNACAWCAIGWAEQGRGIQFSYRRCQSGTTGKHCGWQTRSLGSHAALCHARLCSPHNRPLPCSLGRRHQRSWTGLCRHRWTSVPAIETRRCSGAQLINMKVVTPLHTSY